MDKEYKISWGKIIGITALIIIVIAIICLVYPKKNNNLLVQQTYIDNMTLMKNAGFEYFTGSNLPENIGDSEKISLDELLARNLIVEFLDEEGNSCNKENSYIEAVKVAEDEYEMQVYLSCNNKSDYIVTSIANNVVCVDCNNTNVSATKTDTLDINNNENNNRGTILPTYSSEISNSGSDRNYNNSTTDTNKTVNVWHTTNVNINYVNTCCTDGNTTNCSDNCLSNVYHTVIFDANGGSSVQNQIVRHGELAIYKTTYRYGYKFLGWYLNGVKYDFDTPVTKKITLVAKWQKEDIDNNTYIVDFDSNGGSYVPSQEILEGNKAKRPSNPVKDCYDFGGWYTDKALTKKYDFNTSVTSDITLYAKWIENDTCKNTYLVKFNSNGGTSVTSQKVLEGNKAYEPEDPTRNGYKFLGWYLNGSKFNFNTRIYKNITLVAKWEYEEEKYYEYCKIDTNTYYSTSYVSDQKDVWNYSWKIRFNDLRNVENVNVIDVGYINTTSMYNTIYNNSFNNQVSMVGGNDLYSVAITSGSMLKKYSFKASNFTPDVGQPYYSNGYWYANLSVRVKNYNNVTSYYASNIGGRIYFVPFYFKVEYTNLDNCVTDKASNSYKYDDYEIVDSFWK